MGLCHTRSEPFKIFSRSTDGRRSLKRFVTTGPRRPRPRRARRAVTHRDGRAGPRGPRRSALAALAWTGRRRSARRPVRRLAPAPRLRARVGARGSVGGGRPGAAGGLRRAPATSRPRVRVAPRARAREGLGARTPAPSPAPTPQPPLPRAPIPRPEAWEPKGPRRRARASPPGPLRGEGLPTDAPRCVSTRRPAGTSEEARCGPGPPGPSEREGWAQGVVGGPGVRGGKRSGRDPLRLGPWRRRGRWRLATGPARRGVRRRHARRDATTSSLAFVVRRQTRKIKFSWFTFRLDFALGDGRPTSVDSCDNTFSINRLK